MKKVALFGATTLLLMACGADTESVEEDNITDVETEEVVEEEVVEEEEGEEEGEEDVKELENEVEQEEVGEEREESGEEEGQTGEEEGQTGEDEGETEPEEESVVVEETTESFDEIIEREYGIVALITHDEENKVYELMPVLNDVQQIAMRVNRGDEEALAEWEEIKTGLANMHHIQVNMIGEDYTLSLMHPNVVDTELLMMFDNQINDIPRNAVYSVDEYIN